MQITIKAIVPKTILDQKVVVDNIQRIMKAKSAPEVKRLFRQTVNGWDHKPDFLNKANRTTNSISQTIWAGGSNGHIYSWVNFGTDPHPIPKSGTTPMHFKWGGPGSYKPSTRPRILKSGRHSQSGNLITMYKVNHPGIEEPREFDKTIAKEYTPTFRRDINRVIVDATKKAASPSNHETL